MSMEKAYIAGEAIDVGDRVCMHRDGKAYRQINSDEYHIGISKMSVGPDAVVWLFCPHLIERPPLWVDVMSDDTRGVLEDLNYPFNDER